MTKPVNVDVLISPIIYNPINSSAPSAGLNGNLGELALHSNVVNLQEQVDILNSTTLALSNEVSSLPVGITGQNGLQIQQVSPNQFIISLYIALTGNLSLSQSNNEIGSSISLVNLAWSYNKSIISQSLNNTIGTLPTTSTSYNYAPTLPITSNTTFILTASDGTNTINPSTSVSFLNKRYWGTLPTISGGLPSNSQILSSNSELSNSRSKTIVYDCSNPAGGNFFWFAYPASLGIGSVTVNNLSFTDWYNPSNPTVSNTTPALISLTNASGYTSNYYIYRVFNSQSGSSISVAYG